MIPTGAGYERALRTALKINIYLDGWTKLWGPDRAQELFDQARQRAITTLVGILAACQQIQDRELSRPSSPSGPEEMT